MEFCYDLLSRFHGADDSVMSCEMKKN
jgi:hypothetical protein